MYSWERQKRSPWWGAGRKNLDQNTIDDCRELGWDEHADELERIFAIIERRKVGDKGAFPIGAWPYD